MYNECLVAVTIVANVEVIAKKCLQFLTLRNPAYIYRSSLKPVARKLITSKN